MKNILLPTDFSDNSINAIRYAMQLFKKENCTFYVLNTYTPTIYYIEYVPINADPSGLSNAIRDNLLADLSGIVEKLKTEFKNPNHQFETIAAFNTLILGVAEIVKEKNIDYIVMGTKGATGAKEILFGSNTVHILKNAKCPVLAIPSGFKFEPLYDILFPTDYELDYQDKHLQPILNLAQVFNARVNILNASYGYDLSETQETYKQKLEIYFKTIAHLFHSVSNQTVQEAITNFQMNVRVNLMVMINNKHSFFENLLFKNTINQIGFHLDIPFLVIPSKV